MKNTTQRPNPVDLLRGFLKAPAFPDSTEKTRNAANLFVLLRFSLLVITFSLLFFPTLSMIPNGWLLIALILLNTLGLMALAHLGKVQLSSHIYIFSTWVILMASSLDTGGVSAVGYSGGGLLTILLAGFLLRRRYIMLYLLLNVIVGVMMALLELNQLLPVVRLTDTPWSRLVATLAFLMSGSGLAFVMLRSIQNALTAAEKELRERHLFEEALFENENRYRIISEMISDYAYAYDIAPDGTLIPVWITDDSFTRLTGYKWKEIGGTMKLYHPDDVPRAAHDIQQTLTGQPVTGEYRILTKSGQMRWLHIVRQIAWDEANTRPVALYGSAQDITERKLAELEIHDLNDRLKSQALQLATLNDMGRDISALNDLGVTVRRVLEKLKPVLPLDVFFVALLDEDSGMLTFPILYDDGQIWDQPPDRLREQSWVAQVIRSGEPYLYNRTEQEIKLARGDPYRLGAVDRVTASMMIAPLPSGERSIGVVSVQSYTRNVYSRRDVEFLTSAGYQIAVAVENARLYDSLQAELEERRKLETQLQAYTNRLELVVDERTTALRHTNEQLELVLNTTTNALAFADPSGNILVANPAFHATFAHREMVAVEHILWALTDSEQMQRMGEGLLRVIYDEESLQIEVEIATPTGERRDLDLVLYPVGYAADGGRSGVLISSNDITQRKQMERLKAHFVADAVHDLATPISGLSSRIYLLKRDPNRLPVHVKALENQIGHLRNLLEDLRTLSRLDRGEMAFEMDWHDPAELLQRVYDTYEPVAIEQNQRLLLHCPVQMVQAWLDQRQIERVLVNLVSNALRYTPAGREISIHCQLAGDMLLIYVKDEGMGIAPEDQPRVFERFFRTDEARSSVASGTGLGLSISKHIIERHGGSISVESEVGVGSTFTLRLPLEPKATSRPEH